MQISKISVRYAKAILDSLKTPKAADSVIEELRSFHSLMTSSKELELVLTSHLFSEETREEILSDLGEKLKLSKETLRILKTISAAKRMKFLKSIADTAHYLKLESQGVIPLMVLAANELTGDEKKKLEKKFSKLLGKDVEASYEVEPSLIGGAKVTAAGRTYDGSVAGWLNTFEEQLVGGSI